MAGCFYYMLLLAILFFISTIKRMVSFFKKLFSAFTDGKKNSKTYLFFDVECANCYGGQGKMCSFGYVLTDKKFNVIESDDLVMNPECEFDWYLFKNKNDIKLAYPKEYFYSQPSFPHFYGKIKSLLTSPDRTVFTFGYSLDLGFVVTALQRYKCRWFDFAAYDIERHTKEENGIHGKLAERCALLKIDTSDLKKHNSRDDAMMTMRLLKAWCKRKRISVDTFLKNAGDSYCSTQKFLRMRARKLQKKAKKPAQPS